MSSVPLIGALRWDAWYDPNSGSVSQAVETDLSPAAFQSRAPAFAQPNNDGGLTINGDNQSQMTLEINQASRAGIDYWAFDLYSSEDPLSNALNLYLANPINSLVKFCVVDGLGWGVTDTTYKGAIDSRMGLFENRNYQAVDGGRPLYYAILPTDKELAASWGDDPHNLKPAVDYLRTRIEATTGQNPYIVLLGDPITAAAYAQLTGADAISSYAPHGVDPSGTFGALSNESAGEWNTALATGLSVIPTVMTGWDPTPRVDNPPSFGGSGPGSYTLATASQIASQLSYALDWSAAHPTGANTALVYAWNEFDEGGWLAPTYVPGNSAGDTSRLDAIGQVLATARTGSVTKNADGTYVSKTSDGTIRSFSERGVLLTEQNADNILKVFSQDGTISVYGPTADLIEVDLNNGSKKLYNKDGSQTYYNAAGQVSKIVRADGSTQTACSDGWLFFESNGTYLQHESDQPDGSKRLYSSKGSLTEIDHADGGKTLVAPNGDETVRNSAGSLTEVDKADGSKELLASDGTQTFYDAAGKITKIVSADGSTRTAYSAGWLYFGSDGTYLRHESDQPDGSKQVYNSQGMLTEIDLPDGSRSLVAADGTKTFYSPAGLETKVVNSDGSMKIAYPDGWLYFDASGAYLMHEADDAAGARQFYGPSGLLVEIDHADGGKTLVAPNGDETVRNSAGSLTEVDKADGSKELLASDGTQTFYDAAGKITKIVSADGSTRTAYSDGWLYFGSDGTYLRHESDQPDGSKQVYNSQGMLTEIDLPDGSRSLVAADGTKTFYSPAGLETKVVNSDGSMKIAYPDGWLYFDASSPDHEGRASLQLGETGVNTQSVLPYKIAFLANGVQSVFTDIRPQDYGPIGSGPDDLKLPVSEDAWMDHALFSASVDGQQVGGLQTLTSAHQIGDPRSFDVFGTFKAGMHEATLNFYNDAYESTATIGRSLYLDQAMINNIVVTHAVLKLDGSGPQ